MYININPVAYKIGNLQFHWFGIFMVIGLLFGLFLLYLYLKERKVKLSLFYDLIFVVALHSIIGARLVYVIFNWNLFRSDLWQIIMLWQGGFSFVGAFLCGILAIYLFTKKHRQDLWIYLDGSALALPLIYALASWGNYFTQDDFGLPTSSWLGYKIEALKRPFEYLSYTKFHPTFIYESVWNLIVFAALLLLYFSKKLKKGELFFSYLIIYPLGRIVIEYFRINVLMIGPVKIYYIACVISILVGSYLILDSRKLIGSYKVKSQKYTRRSSKKA